MINFYSTIDVERKGTYLRLISGMSISCFTQKEITSSKRGSQPSSLRLANSIFVFESDFNAFRISKDFFCSVWHKTSVIFRSEERRVGKECRL